MMSGPALSSVQGSMQGSMQRMSAEEIAPSSARHPAMQSTAPIQAPAFGLIDPSLIDASQALGPPSTRHIVASHNVASASPHDTDPDESKWAARSRGRSIILIGVAVVVVLGVVLLVVFVLSGDSDRASAPRLPAPSGSTSP